MRKKLFFVALFGMTMGYFEAAVVVYLRSLYYPNGFSFPVVLLERNNPVAVTEILREIASMAMILSVAWLAGKSSWERFAHFCIIFGTWDILYYATLRLILGWPDALSTWDILFLLPVPWLGPVWAPLVVSLSLIAGGGCLLFFIRDGGSLHVPAWVWGLEVAGGALVMGAFMWDFRVVLNEGIPQHFAWPLFWLGEGLGLAGLIAAIRLQGKKRGSFL